MHIRYVVCIHMNICTYVCVRAYTVDAFTFCYSVLSFSDVVAHAHMHTTIALED